MKNIPKAGEVVELEKYIHLDECGSIGFWDNDNSSIASFGACVGKTVISFVMPVGKPVDAMVSSLQEQIKTERANHHVKIKNLEDKIQQLLAIGHDGGVL